MNYGEAKKILEKTFNQDNFNEVNFKEFLHHLFAKKINIGDSVQSIEPEYQSHIQSCKIIGEFVDINNQEIVFLIVKLAPQKELDRSRTLQRNFIAEILKNSFKSYALVAFVSSDEANWRFSLVKLEISFNENNLHEKLSSARRFSFLVGKNEGTHTVQSQFLKFFIDETQNIAPTIAQIEKLFDIEAVTDEFFERYKELYHLFHEALDSFLEANEKEQKHFIEKEISTSDFAKKTLGQIVFLYFLQKKGWFGVKVGESWGGGDKNFLANYFTRTKDHKNFFNDCLEPLFYEALAVDRGLESIYKEIDNLRFPFLNGGLFETIRDYSWKNTELNLPNELFSNSHPLPKIVKNSKNLQEKNKFIEGECGTGIFDIFNRYNFTVNENEPLENEVAIDPEMLGKVFENLLEIKDRKSTGSFYTPRPIVHYMCQEALIQYLLKQTSLPQSDLSAFIKNHQITPEIQQTALKIDKLLENVKICDPAIGSGAFALGALNEIVGARLALASENSPQNSYQFKLHAISNSIYGVDLEPSAVEIAKLRLWLSLVVEEQEPRPLPNLEYKIMQGNSLIETIEGIKLFDDEVINKNNKIENQESQIQKKLEIINKELILEAQNNKAKSQNPEYLAKLKEQSTLNKTLKNLKSYDQLDQIKEETKAPTLGFIDNENSAKNILLEKFYQLQKFIKNFFTENNRTQKLELKKQIDELKWQFIEATLITQKKQDKLAEIQNLRRKNIRPFFIWKLEFCDVFSGENPGFDIVIGNPPYIQLQKNGGSLAKMYEKSKFESFARAGDIYCLFYEFGLSLLKPNAHLVFITSNKWMRAGYGEKLRNFLSQKTNPKILIDLGPGVFETATVDTNILLYQKKSFIKNNLQNLDNSSVGINCIASTIKESLTKTNQKLEDYLAKNHLYLQNFSGESWIISNQIEAKIKAKIEAVGVKLKDWDIKINYGIKTGFNEAFIIDTKTKEELCLADPKSVEIIKPILRGRDISRYSVKWAGLWVIGTFPALKIKIENYPAIENYLKKFGKRLNQTGGSYIDEQGNLQKSRKKTGNQWFETQDQIGYYKEFEKEKIVWTAVNAEYKLSIVKENFFLNNSIFIITGSYLKFLLSIFNSLLFRKYVNFFLGGEENYMYGSKDIFEQIPIPQIPASSQAPFIAIVDDILAITNKPDYNPNFPPLRQKELEAKIDEMVCDLYQLDDEEKKLILGEKNVF